MVLSQLGMLELFDSPVEDLLPIRSGWKVEWGKLGGWEKGRGLTDVGR